MNEKNKEWYSKVWVKDPQGKYQLHKQTSFREHVENLLRNGKRIDHEDFQLLSKAFGSQKIEALIEEILLEKKKLKEESETTEVPFWDPTVREPGCDDD